MGQIKQYSPTLKRAAAWGVHLFTASGACVGILTLYEIYQHEYIMALWLMAISLIIDAIDGSLARAVDIKNTLPKIDGALLDNIVDFLNYVTTPCFFLLVNKEMLPANYSIFIILAITLASSYQFCQADAKTPDHFFKGFPCYWNYVVFYMYILNSSMTFNALFLSFLCILIFVPIKYLYPSRLDYLTDSTALKILMHCCSLVYALSSAFLLLDYPNTDDLWLSLSLGYIGMYLFLSFYRTYSPMMRIKKTSIKG